MNTKKNKLLILWFLIFPLYYVSPIFAYSYPSWTATIEPVKSKPNTTQPTTTTQPKKEKWVSSFFDPKYFTGQTNENIKSIFTTYYKSLSDVQNQFKYATWDKLKTLQYQYVKIWKEEMWKFDQYVAESKKQEFNDYVNAWPIIPWLNK